MAFSYGDLDPNYVRPTEGKDNSEEDLDFSYLFHYNRPEFSTGGDNGEISSILFRSIMQKYMCVCQCNCRSHTKSDYIYNLY